MRRQNAKGVTKSKLKELYTKYNLIRVNKDNKLTMSKFHSILDLMLNELFLFSF